MTLVGEEERLMVVT